MRYLSDLIAKDLESKMVLLGGPRQVGKTTLARFFLDDLYKNKGRYLNWDFDEHRRDILGRRWSKEDHLLILDEIHKYENWKNWLKGEYDTNWSFHHYLITGSARLDTYKKGGDSLAGRYHYWRLHPITLDDYPSSLSQEEAFRRLMTLGGFPEPFFKDDEREARRWRRERLDRIIREDIRDLEEVRKIRKISLFLDLLRGRVGSLLSLNNLAGDLGISPVTASGYLEVLERMYLLFSIRPYTRKVGRSILKAPKIYFFDNGDVLGKEGVVFENFVATALLKRLHYREDYEGYRMSLHYLRDKEGHEVDFVLAEEGEMKEMIEVKLSESEISPSLKYFHKKFPGVRAIQLTADRDTRYEKEGIEVMSVFDYFNGIFSPIEFRL